jgi:hypothetical protein
VETPPVRLRALPVRVDLVGCAAQGCPRELGRVGLRLRVLSRSFRRLLLKRPNLGVSKRFLTFAWTTDQVACGGHTLAAGAGSFYGGSGA